MGNKITDELVSTVLSIVGSEYSEMDAIRALHMAKNDATAAINIIFDTPNLKSKRNLGLPKKNEGSRSDLSSETQSVTLNSKRNDDMRNNFDSRIELNGGDCPANSGDRSVEDVRRCESSVGSEDWWLVGRGELAGLSTSKGRRVKAGDEVAFTFPSQNASNSLSSGKLFGRGRHVGTCSEIVRFSTRDSGEVICNK